MDCGVFTLYGSFRPLGFAGTGKVLLLVRGGEEHAGVLGVADSPARSA
jgi:hypothetical protein